MFCTDKINYHAAKELRSFNDKQNTGRFGSRKVLTVGQTKKKKLYTNNT